MGALISIIGPPASGKTTLAEWLSRAMPARLVKEDFAGNPFVADFFLGRRDLALPSQLYFLFSRLGQLRRSQFANGAITVSDYGFCQDAVYARYALCDEDFALYSRLSAPMAELVKTPDVIIHLDAAEQVLLERIARRARGYEKTFTLEFLSWMRQQYARLAGELACPVIHVDVATKDLRQEAEQTWLMKELREVLS
jgi:deoxyguanosine kinase